MKRIVSTISDRMLSLVAPKVEASAVVFCGCCDWKVCKFASDLFQCGVPNGHWWCAQCAGDRCA